MKKELLPVFLGVMLLLGVTIPAMAVGPNGYVDSSTSDPPITVGADWYATINVPPAFFWTGGPSVFSYSGPFTFSAGEVRVDVTDDFLKGDQFRIYDWGVPIGETSAVSMVSGPEVGPEAAFNDATYSSGSFFLGPGAHSIDIEVIAGYSSGRGYIRVMEKMCDVKPGSWPNPINLKSKGKIPVAILGSSDLDVTQIDPSSLVFECAPAVKSALEDVNLDGHMDLIAHFKTQDTCITDGQTVAAIDWTMLDGTPMSCADAIRTVP